MMTINMNDLTAHFRFEGSPLDIVPCLSGHINDTYVVRYAAPNGFVRRYILQRINQNVFRDPQAVMENVEQVTRHLRAKIIAADGDPERETLNLIPTLKGVTFYRDPVQGFWRAYRFIEGARTYETAESSQHVYNAAWAFGNFQRQLSDFPADRLHETIPNFHHTPKRFEAFEDAVRRDPARRVREVEGEISFIEQREAHTRVLIDGIADGVFPLRVTHNDTKFNNVMIDDQTGKGICIIDLDTVMPGLALYDFGDAVRSAAALVAEDAPDWTRAGIDLDTFDHLAHGYLDAARAFLTPAEVDHLAFSARLITLEQAIRFLADYINGDVYYKVHRPGHNLDRARTQIRMIEDMEAKFDQMKAIIDRYR